MIRPRALKRRTAFTPVLVGLLTLATACDGDGPAGPALPAVTGTWIGTEGGLTFEFELTESESGLLDGQVTISSAENTLRAAVLSGRRELARVVMVIGAAGFQNATFRGDVSTDTVMILGVDGFGFTDEDEFELMLQRRSASTAIAFRSGAEAREGGRPLPLRDTSP